MVPRHGGLAARCDPSMADYAAFSPPGYWEASEAANVYGLLMTSFRFAWLVVWVS